MIRFKPLSVRPRIEKPTHHFAIGQVVRMKSHAGMTRKVAEIFAIKGMLPVRDGSPQYRIRSEQETHDRVAAEDNLETIEPPAA